MNKNFSDSSVRKLFSKYESINSPVADISEFKEDVMRFTYVNRLLKKYKETGNLNYNLLINHIVILYNVFGASTNEFLNEFCEEDIVRELNSVLVYMNRIKTDNFCVQTFNLIDHSIKEHSL